MQTEQIPIPFSSHAELTLRAREALKNNWGNAVLISLVYIIIVMAAGIIPGGGILVGGPLSIGLAVFALNISQGKYAEVGQLFIKSDRLLNALLAYVVYSFVVGIGLVLLIVPGIIVSIGLSQTFYLMAKDEELDPIEALKKSWEITKGYKWDLFVFSLRFIPWAILCVLTCGVGFLWLLPYMQVSFANYHLELTEDDGEDSFDAIDHLIEY